MSKFSDRDPVMEARELSKHQRQWVIGSELGLTQFLGVAVEEFEDVGAVV